MRHIQCCDEPMTLCGQPARPSADGLACAVCVDLDGSCQCPTVGICPHDDFPRPGSEYRLSGGAALAAADEAGVNGWKGRLRFRLAGIGVSVVDGWREFPAVARAHLGHAILGQRFRAGSCGCLVCRGHDKGRWIS